MSSTSTIPTSTASPEPDSIPTTGPAPTLTSVPITTLEPAATTTTPAATVVPGAPPEPVSATEIAVFDTPVDLAVRPGDPAWYVVEQGGRVIRFDPATNQSAVVLDVTDLTEAEGERGLLGLAFSPDGSAAYVNFTDDDGNTHVQRADVAADGSFRGDPTDVLFVDQPYGNHNGGALTFGPDGYLYVPLGDGGSANDPERRGSDPTSLLGSLLRIDPTGDASDPYRIPSDNPFASGSFNGTEGAPEVWAWGLRNPWRVTFDPETGDLWIADVGQSRLEEVNRVQPTPDHGAGYGKNFGWSAFEGTDRFNDDVEDPGDLVSPVLTYEHGEDGCSVSGAAVYRGVTLPTLVGDFIYGDYCSGKLWVLDLASGRNDLLLDGFESLTAVRSGPDGEVYVLEGGGAVHRLVPG